MISVHRACTTRVRLIRHPLENRASFLSALRYDRSLDHGLRSDVLTAKQFVAWALHRPGEQPRPLLESAEQARQRIFYMSVIIVPESQTWSVIRAPALSAASESVAPRYARSPIGSAFMAEHDAALLVAALEEIDTRRAALEWLLEADLLRYCLV